MIVRTGTSGYSYASWRGSFYPEGTPTEEMLPHYAKRLDAVELNNTFYRMPKAVVIERWRSSVPATFRFCLKASRRVTHFARLRPPHDALEFLLKNTSALGETLGVLLFQLPPNMRKDATRLREFLTHIPSGLPVAFEFRHPEWYDDEVCGVLEEGNHTLVISDVDGKPSPELVFTSERGYIRLRRERYRPDELLAWADRIRATPWHEVFVFVKHEEAAAGPRAAKDLADLFEESGG